MTEALVAEGRTLQAAEQEGGVTEDTLVVIRDQYEALEYLAVVVDRRQRVEYIEAREDADLGDLRPLVRMFARLEGVALRSELIRPTEVVPAGGERSSSGPRMPSTSTAISTTAAGGANYA